jgi:LCP family protein required for cell wall assembly
VSIGPVTKRVAMFGLPRDTVDVAPPGPARSVFGTVYAGKINSLWTQARARPDLFPGNDRQRGYVALKDTLGYLYGLDIRWYVTVNFDGFKTVVDTLGGVTVNVQTPVVDDRYPGDSGRLVRLYIPSGVQHMDGSQALMYARSRHTSTDFDRGQRQQRVLLSLKDQADYQRLIARLPDLVSALKSAVKTDIPVGELPQLLQLAQSVDSSKITSYVLAPPLYQREVISGDPRGYVLIPKLDRSGRVADAFAADPTRGGSRGGGEGATIWVSTAAASRAGAQIASYLEYRAPTRASDQKPDTQGLTTRIEVFSSAETTARDDQAAQAAFGVTAVPATDPASRVDIVITTSRRTPELTPPPAP